MYIYIYIYKYICILDARWGGAFEPPTSFASWLCGLRPAATPPEPMPRAKARDPRAKAHDPKSQRLQPPDPRAKAQEPES